jgi:hypothetical protein
MTIPLGAPVWAKSNHEPLICAVCLPLSRLPDAGPWKFRDSTLAQQVQGELPWLLASLLLYWSNPVSQVLRAMAVKRTTRGCSNFGELMTVKIS